MYRITVRELAKEIFYGTFLSVYVFSRAMSPTILQLTYVNLIYIGYIDYEWPSPVSF